MTKNQKAFLDMLAHSEIGASLLKITDNGYNVLVGATPSKPLTFGDYSDHPNIYNKKMNSTAAGRYQFLSRDWAHYRSQLGLQNFSPESQDKWALQLIKECRALPDIDAGNFAAAVEKCKNIWASLPGAGYGQRENKIAALQAAYVNAGGGLA